MNTICTRCGAAFEAAGRAKYCPACRVAAWREAGKLNKPLYDPRQLLERQTRSLQRAAADRRRAMFTRLRARDAAAPKCRVTVELRNGVRVETRGNPCGSCVGARGMYPNLGLDRLVWDRVH